jgi:hypothetical protein
MPNQGFSVPPYIQQNSIGSNYSLNGELPPEIAVKEQALNRRQQIANLLLQKSMQSPQGQMAGRFFVPSGPAQGIAQLGSAAAGAYINHNVDQGRTELDAENKQHTVEAIQRYIKQTSPTPAHALPEGTQGPTNAEIPVAPDARRQALVEAMTSKIPGLAQFAQADFAAANKPPEHFDAGDRILLVQNGKVVGAIPKGVTPDTAANNQTKTGLHATPSGDTIANNETKVALHNTVSGDAAAGIRSKEAMHATASGDTIAAQAGQNQRNAEVSGNTAATIAANKDLANIHEAGANQRHSTVSGDAALNDKGHREMKAKELEMRAEENLAERNRKIDEATARLADVRLTNQEREQTKREIARMHDERQKSDQELRREIAAMRSGPAAHDGVKLKPGERFKADGTIEAVPGSSEYVKQSGLHSKDYAAVQTVDIKTNNAMKKLDEILDDKNKGAFNGNFGGYNAYITQHLPGATQDVRTKIDSLKSDLKMAGLEMIRSGGGIGTMTEKEWPIVEQMIASISPKMSEKEAREALMGVRSYLEKIRDNAKEIYSTEWGSTQYYKGNKEADMKRDMRAESQRMAGGASPKLKIVDW